MNAAEPITPERFVEDWRGACCSAIRSQLNQRLVRYTEDVIDDLLQELLARFWQWCARRREQGKTVVVTGPFALARKFAATVVSDWRRDNCSKEISLSETNWDGVSEEADTELPHNGFSEQFVQEFMSIVNFLKTGKGGRSWRPAEVVKALISDWSVERAAQELGRDRHYVKVNLDRFVQEVRRLKLDCGPPQCLLPLYQYVCNLEFQEMVTVLVPTHTGQVSAFMRAHHSRPVLVKDDPDQLLVLLQCLSVVTLEQDSGTALENRIRTVRLVGPGAIAEEPFNARTVLKELNLQALRYAHHNGTAEETLLTLGTRAHLLLSWGQKEAAVRDLRRALGVARKAQPSEHLEPLFRQVASLLVDAERSTNTCVCRRSRTKTFAKLARSGDRLGVRVGRESGPSEGFHVATTAYVDSKSRLRDLSR